MKNYSLNSREKFEPGLGFEPRTSIFLAWHFTTWSYLSSIDGTGLNLSPENNAMQGIAFCDTICHPLTGKLTSDLLIIYFFNQIDK